MTESPGTPRFHRHQAKLPAPTGSRLLLGSVAVAAIVTPLFGGGAGFLAGVAALAVTRLVTTTAFGPSLDVGVDGVYLKRWHKARFIPHQEIEGATLLPPKAGWWRLSLHLRDGEVVVLTTTRAGTPEALEDDTGRALVVAILRAKHLADTRAKRWPPLEPGARPADEWLATLRQVGGGSYRTQGLDRETLERIVDDPAVPTSERIAAAIALEAAGGERSRLGGAIQQVAHPGHRRLVVRVLAARSTEEVEDVLRSLLDDALLLSP